MRITTSMLTTNFLYNTTRNLNNMQTLQNQLSTGKEISRPSDDPYKVSRIMELYGDMDANEQYNENIKDMNNWLETTDSALSQIGNLFSRTKELLVSAGNASYGSTERLAINYEISEKINNFAQIINTNFEGAYIFGGSKSTSKPVVVENGKLMYSDENGNSINIKGYKQIMSDGTTTITDEPKVANTLKSVPLTNTEKAALQEELKAENLTTERKNDIIKLLGSGEQIYKKTYQGLSLTDPGGNTNGTAPPTDPPYHIITLFGLDDLQKKELNAELKDVNTSETRKNEITQILNTNFSSGTTKLFRKTMDTLTFDGTVPNTAYTLSTADQAALKLERDGDPAATPTPIAPASSERKAQIDKLLATIPATPPTTPIYTTADGKITTEQYTKNEEVYLGISDMKKLRAELDKLNSIPVATLTTAQKNRIDELDGFLHAQAYKKSDGTITSDSGGSNTAYNLSANPATITLLTTDRTALQALTPPLTQAQTDRLNELNDLLDPINPKPAYITSPGGIITTSPTVNTKINLTDANVTSIRSELKTLQQLDRANNPALTPTQRTRLEDVQKIIDANDIKEIQLNQIDATLQTEISQGVFINYNKTASDVLEFADKDGNMINISNLFSEIIKNLTTDSAASKKALTGENLKQIDAAIDNLLKTRAEVGAMQNRMESAEKANKTENLNMTDILSKTEDIDVAQKTMEYSVLRTVYQASLQTSGKVLPMTIMDYL